MKVLRYQTVLTMKIFGEDPECVKMSEEFFRKWNPLIVPKSRKGEIWTQINDLTVEFK